MASENPHAEKDICVLFVFHSDGCIELNLSKQQETPNKGWEVFPLQKPCKVHLCISILVIISTVIKTWLAIQNCVIKCLKL